MESEDKWELLIMLIVLVLASFVAGALMARQAYSGEHQPRSEREERVGWACWQDEWADTREAQRRYLEQKQR